MTIAPDITGKMATFVKEIDISRPLDAITIPAYCRRCYFLIKIGDRPIGKLIMASNKKKKISWKNIIERCRQNFSWELATIEVEKYFGLIKKPLKSSIGISVVVCTRNRAHYLRDCLKSLLLLDYETFEIIVVDNAPDNEETFNLVNEFGVRYVRENRPGLDLARNRGILSANFDIVAFTDDDARVDKGWARAISMIFDDEEVMAASGPVLPAELETRAQELFELGYGGMSHGFQRKAIIKENINESVLIGASGFGVGANMAFRKEVFDHIGSFDPALDVGTPSCGGGDIDMFHRVVAKGFTLIYEPSMLVWHLHRRDLKGLLKQVYQNGKSFSCYLMTCYANGTVSRLSLVIFFLRNWLYRWHLKNLIRRKRVPRKLMVMELLGVCSSPVAYFQSKRYANSVATKMNRP